MQVLNQVKLDQRQESELPLLISIDHHGKQTEAEMPPWLFMGFFTLYISV